MKPSITEDMKIKYTQHQLNKVLNHVPVFKHCPECGGSFDAKTYIFRPTAIYPRINEFCSQQCKQQGAGKKNKTVFREYLCGGCGSVFVPHKAKPHQKFCSHQCYSTSRLNRPRPEMAAWIHKIIPPTGSVSKAEREWLAQFTITHYQHPIRALNGKTYRVDGFDENSNTIYEYLGSFWHGNPDIYDSNEIHPVAKIPFGILYERTINRIDILSQSGFTVVTKWSPR